MAAPVKRELILGYSPWAYHGQPYPFERLFKYDINVKEVGFDHIDCFFLSGGEDWFTGYYNEPKHPLTGCGLSPSARDNFEWRAMLYCMANDIPMIGICRGAQGLCIAAGGSLVQHVDGHNLGGHNIVTEAGEIVYSNSVHHQMMNPWKAPHKLLAWTEKPRSSRYENGNRQDIREMQDHEEPEIVYFPDIRGLAIQGHPEYQSASKEFQELCCSYIEEYLL